MNSTPDLRRERSLIESLIDFSTPMSTLTSKLDDKQETTVEKLQDALNQYEKDFGQTKNYLKLLDVDLNALNSTLEEFKRKFDEDNFLSSNRSFVENQLEEINNKTKEVQKMVDQLESSSSVNETIHQILEQISPSTKNFDTSNLFEIYSALIRSIETSFQNRKRLIENVSLRQNRIERSVRQIDERREILVKTLRKLIEQKKIQRERIENLTLEKFHRRVHDDQSTEFAKLNEEFLRLENENRTLKIQIKENLRTLCKSLDRIVV